MLSVSMTLSPAVDVLAAVHAEQAEHEHEERETSSHYKYDAEKQGPQAKHVERV